MRCNVCGSGETSTKFILGDVVVLECRHCKQIFTDTDKLNFMENYDDKYYYAKHKQWFNNPNTDYFKMILSRVKGVGATSLIDLGCGNGDLLKYIRSIDKTIKLVGVDTHRNISGDEIRFIQSPIEDLNIGDKFDVVVSAMVIEHLCEFAGYLSKIVSLLNDNGIAVITTINSHSTLYRTAELLANVGMMGPLVRLYDRHHLSHFNKKSLAYLLVDNGFNLLETLNHNAPLSSFDAIYDNGKIAQAVYKAGVGSLFLLGSLSGETYATTVVMSYAGGVSNA